MRRLAYEKRMHRDGEWQDGEGGTACVKGSKTGVYGFASEDVKTIRLKRCIRSGGGRENAEMIGAKMIGCKDDESENVRRVRVGLMI